MNADRWSDLVGRLQDDGQISERGTRELEDRPGTVEYIISVTPLGKVQLSFTTEPRKISQKALYSKRGGSTANIEVKYDDEDLIHIFTVEREVNDEWVEMDPKLFS